MTEFRSFWMRLGLQETLATFVLGLHLSFSVAALCRSWSNCVPTSFPVASKLCFLQVSVIH